MDMFILFLFVTRIGISGIDAVSLYSIRSTYSIYKAQLSLVQRLRNIFNSLFPSQHQYYNIDVCASSLLEMRTECSAG